MAAQTLLQPKKELRSAERALQRMLVAQDVDSFEAAWRDFLVNVEKAWVKTERDCVSKKTFRVWQDKFKKLRSEDQLLRYIYQARHADQHSVQDILGHTPGRIEIPGPVAINSLIISEGNLVHYDGTQPLTYYPPQIKLVRVTNRGVDFDPPSEHLGATLVDPGPVGVARLALAFYGGFLAQVEQKYFVGKAR
jgi:hypothetical protein